MFRKAARCIAGMPGLPTVIGQRFCASQTQPSPLQHGQSVRNWRSLNHTRFDDATLSW
jgi:hypothetical protein